MAREGLLTAWKELPEEERRSILAELQKLADTECESAKKSAWVVHTWAPVIDVYSAARFSTEFKVFYFYHFRHSCQAQSGSDWDDHYFHRGEAVCHEGKVLSHQIKSDCHVIPEYENPVYDPDAEAAKRRAAAVEDHWNEWWSLPFPFPE